MPWRGMAIGAAGVAGAATTGRGSARRSGTMSTADGLVHVSIFQGSMLGAGTYFWPIAKFLAQLLTR